MTFLDPNTGLQDWEHPLGSYWLAPKWHCFLGNTSILRDTATDSFLFFNQESFQQDNELACL